MANELELLRSFYYPELRTLSLTLLALGSFLFVFSLAFAERFATIGPRFGARQVPLVMAWGLFAAALACAGFALFELFMLAEFARGGLPAPGAVALELLLRRVFLLLDLGSSAFGGALLLLALSVCAKLFAAPREQLREDTRASPPERLPLVDRV